MGSVAQTLTTSETKRSHLPPRLLAPARTRWNFPRNPGSRSAAVLFHSGL